MADVEVGEGTVGEGGLGHVLDRDEACYAVWGGSYLNLIYALCEGCTYSPKYWGGFWAYALRECRSLDTVKGPSTEPNGLNRHEETPMTKVCLTHLISCANAQAMGFTARKYSKVLSTRHSLVVDEFEAVQNDHQ